MDNVRILPLCAMTKWDTPNLLNCTIGQLHTANSSFTKKKKIKKINKRKRKETSREVVEKKTSRRLSVQHLGSATDLPLLSTRPLQKCAFVSEPTTRFRLVLQTRV